MHVKVMQLAIERREGMLYKWNSQGETWGNPAEVNSSNYAAVWKRLAEY